MTIPTASLRALAQAYPELLEYGAESILHQKSPITEVAWNEACEGLAAAINALPHLLSRLDRQERALKQVADECSRVRRIYGGGHVCDLRSCLDATIDFARAALADEGDL